MSNLQRSNSDTLYAVVARSFAIVAILGVLVTLITGLIAALLLQHGYAQENLRLAARQAAYSVEVPIVFNDKRGITETLQPLLVGRSIAAIRVDDAQGREITTVRQVSRVEGFALSLPTWMLPSPADAQIVSAGAQIGRVHVTGSGASATQQLLVSMLGAIIGIALIAFGTVAVARRLNRSLVKPLHAIATVTDRIRDERRLDLRVPSSGLREVRALAGDINNLLEQLQDWQGQMDATHQALLHRANFDPLSGLPNRTTFLDRVRDTIRVAQRTGDSFAILFMDGDNFKDTNDQFGHIAGDRIIAEIGTRISPLLRVGDIAARLGGDEFAILVNHLESNDDAHSVMRRIREAMAVPVRIDDKRQATISLSVGIAIFPHDGSDVENLLRVADQRMYEEKTATRH